MKYNLANNEPFEINGDVYVKGIGKYDGTNAGGNNVKTLQEVLDITEITCSDLVNLINNSNLIPGMKYRITDYNCTTTQTDTRSAGHQFDIIVEALDEKTLSENASAINHSVSNGETDYFANCDLNAWKIWYCLDNDKTRFDWADDTKTNNKENGRGVIYRMIDEFGNDCPYDFKNIQFKRYAVTNVTSTKLTSDALNDLKNTFVYKENEQPIHFSFSSSNRTNDGSTLVIDNNNYGWYYTFSTIKYESKEGYSSVIEDASVIGVNFYNDESGGGCFNNKIEVYRNFMASDDGGLNGCCVLNNIVFNGMYEQDGYAYNAHSNHIKSQSHSNTFGRDCYGNTFGIYCYSNTFGNSCYGSTFGIYCYGNTFGRDCDHNTFGNNCYDNTFGNYCNYNTFGIYCNSNTFGNSCNSNTFGNNCYDNTFGNYCYYNTFGNKCYYNTFGNYLQESQFGDGVKYFSIANASITTEPTSSNLKSYIRWLIVENGVRYVNPYVTASTSSSSYCQNVRICQGCSGTSNSNRKSFDITSCIGSAVSNVYQPANSKTTSV